ncbi:MAG: ribonuclease R [Desulfuromonadales bacterium GWC2_61_20]|nr:MAG: ribonuclease R [Desulfuromonadales bacterium GWC2_61_20]
MAVPVTPEDILKVLEQPPRRPLTAREILAPFALKRDERQTALHLLDELLASGAVVRRSDGRFQAVALRSLVSGTISIHRDGYGFLRPEDADADDVFIPAHALAGIMPGDRLAIRVERSRRRRGQVEGEVVRVLERAHQELVGRFASARSGGIVTPVDPHLPGQILVAPDAAGGARPGDIVIVRIERYAGREQPASGRVLSLLGREDDPAVEILAIVHKYGLPSEFPAPVAAAAALLPGEVAAADLVDRVDLRALPLVTIDGESARDFDDAVAARIEANGCIRLWVAIADVGHYVPAGGVIDVEARERGTSVYFPDRCIPMLPEHLSNGLCSLNPRLDRLTLTAEILFDQSGKRRESSFYAAVIASRERLTYTRASALLDGDAAAEPVPSEVMDSLRTLLELARRLRAMRQGRGSLDFDLPEAELVLDLQGRPEAIVRSERNQAHRLIEECMLAANEAVATYLAQAGAPILYRIHEPPNAEKLIAFQQFVAHFNYGLNLSGSVVDPLELQKLLAVVAGKPEERMINQVLLRSLKQARYAAENHGHFGLAAELYCHFTSPIRRYPDLQVHRALRQTLLHPPRREVPPAVVAELAELAELTSARERRAMEAEREIIALKKCQFMAKRVGEEFDGFIVGVQSFGLFVELVDFFVEGLVRLPALGDDYYQFDPELHRLVGTSRRRIFQIGDAMRVVVEGVDLPRREIDFVPVGIVAASPAQPRKLGRGGLTGDRTGGKSGRDGSKGGKNGGRDGRRKTGR